MRGFVLEEMTVTAAAAVCCTPASRRRGPAAAGAAAGQSGSETGVHQQVLTGTRCAAVCVML